MTDFYKVRKGFKYTGSKPLNNLDYYYGPWASIDEALEEIGDK